MYKLEHFHPGHGISNIWTPDEGRTWSWANRFGEGCGEPTFAEALSAAEAALEAEAGYKRRGIAPVWSEESAFGNPL